MTTKFLDEEAEIKPRKTKTRPIFSKGRPACMIDFPLPDRSEITRYARRYRLLDPQHYRHEGLNSSSPP